MSFCSDVKSELIRISHDKNCCIRAICCGILLASAKSDRSFTIVTESDSSAQFITKTLKRGLNIDPHLSVSPSGGVFTVKISDHSFDKAITRFEGIESGRVQSSVINNDCCKAAFIKGLFITSGQISDPQKEYRFELLFKYKNAADTVFEFFTSLGYSPLKTNRSNTYSLYFKDSTAIEDLLTLLGATSSVLELMEVKVEKDVRNKINRKSNFEVANYYKTYQKSGVHTAAIELLKASGAFDTLSDDLKSTANIRLQYPDASLAELASICGISRSGLNHRLNRLIQLSRNGE